MQTASNTNWIIEADDLAVGYGDKLVLDGVTLRIPRGGITCIVGASGCGKSTLLRTFVGLATPTRGVVSVLGQRLDLLPEAARSALFERIGLMFQEGGLLNSLTVAENLLMPVRAHTQLPDEVARELVKLKLGLVHLEDAADKLPGELSGGMRKRAGLARALMLDPEVVFCDEPSAGLDPSTQADIDGLLMQLRDDLGLTVVVVTHETESIKAIADDVVLLADGQVAFDGPCADAMSSTRADLIDFFGRRGAHGERPASLNDELAGDRALASLVDMVAP